MRNDEKILDLEVATRAAIDAEDVEKTKLLRAEAVTLLAEIERQRACP
jgi:hypothetical protein